MQITDFRDNSPCPAWAAENAAKILTGAGFSEADGVSAQAGQRFFLRPQSGMLAAVCLPVNMDPAKTAWRIIGAHTDSPHLRLKPNTAAAAEGATILTAEIYGGVLNYTWFDRDLGIAGEVYHKDGAKIGRKLVKTSRPVAVVPSLAIHLQRGVNEDGFAPSKQDGLQALFALGSDGPVDFNAFLAGEAGISRENLLSYDLSLFDAQKAATGGKDGELLHSARLDNLVSCYAAVQAITRSNGEHTIQVVLLFDHEEIGSVSESGAEGSFAEHLLRDIAAVAGVGENGFRKVPAQFLSADMAHGVHPNFGNKHDAVNRPTLGGGVTLKINQNRRYATNAEAQAIFHDLCGTHKIPSQIYTHRNDLPCGSTIGPALSARLGMTTMDAGIAMLGMHSIRETCAWEDLNHYANFMLAFLRDS
jgi:aspartyl aminopeptidase